MPRKDHPMTQPYRLTITYETTREYRRTIAAYPTLALAQDAADQLSLAPGEEVHIDAIDPEAPLPPRGTKRLVASGEMQGRGGE